MLKGNGNGKLFYGWIIVVGCVLLSSASGIMMGVISVFIKPVSEAMNVSRGIFTLYSTINLIATMLVLPFAPNLFKRFKFKLLVLFGSVVAGASIFSFSFAKNVYVFYIIAIFAGVSTCFMNAIPIVILTSNWFIEKRGIATSVSFSGNGTSMIVLSPIVMRIIIAYGWQSAYRFLAIVFLILTIPTTLFIIKEKPSDVGLCALGSETPKAGEKVADGFTRKETIKTKSFILFSVGVFFSSLIAFGVNQHLVSYLTDISYTAVKAAYWFSICNVVATIAKALTGAVYDKFGIVKSTSFLSIMLLLALVFLMFAEKTPFLVLFICLFGLSSGLQIVPPTYMTNKFFGDKDYSANYGLITTIYFCGMASGVQLSALFFDKLESYKPAWMVYSILVIFTLILWIFAMNVAKKERRSILGEKVNF